MKRTTDILYYIAMVGLLVWFAYSKGWILADFKSITPEEAIARMHHESNLTLLDVRTPEEFRNGHLIHAINIPLDQLPDRLSQLAPYKAKPMLVYCRSGNRSVSASRILKSHGFTPINVKNGIVGLAGAKAQLVR